MAYCDWHFGLDVIVTTPLFCYARGAILLLLIIPLANTQHQHMSFDYPNFSDAMNSGIQLNKIWSESLEQVTCSEPIHLWNMSSNEQKYFTTHFSFLVSSNQRSYESFDYGLTFFLASSNLPIDNDTTKLNGVGLGLAPMDNKTHPSKAGHKKKSKFTNKKLLEGIGIGIGLALSVSLFVLFCVLLWKMNKGKQEVPTSETTSDLKMDETFQMSTGPKKINYEELVNATNNFEEAHKIGQGGFGCVYKGYLKGLNSYAAIKRISTDSTQGVKEYAAEVTIISQLRHRNVVKLTGWCHKKNDLFLIYEYMPNGSLYSHLFGEESILLWKVRYNIALGLASALFYLQEGWEKCVLHRDIKSSNIMLDSNFNAKLGDFGLARLVDHEKASQTSVVAGTRGYLAPEYMKIGKARKASDIFSFGVVLMELATGRRAIHHTDMEDQVSLVE